MKRRLLPLLCSLALLLSLSGCSSQARECSTTIFAMDTVMTLTFYTEGAQDHANAVQSQMVDTLYNMQNAWDATHESSDIYALNHAAGAPVQADQVTVDLLTSALHLCELTGGALDITAYPAVQAWGFTTGEYRVPGAGELDALVSSIDYAKLSFDAAQTLTLPAGMALDTGAVAKGYAGDFLKIILTGNGITSALLDLGQSSIQTVGTKPDGTPWRVGIQDPAGDTYLGVLELNDQAMGTSGSYQRYFEQDGIRYCHIIDPDTAAPAQSGLASVTVVSDSCLTCDGLSTALFVMGLEEGTQFWREHRELEFEVLFITEEGDLYLTEGLTDSFTLAQGYENREVTVLS